MSEVIRFHNEKAFTGLSGVVDRQNCMIRGVSCITGDLMAEGHNLFVDSTTLTQLHALAKEMGKVPVTVNHDGGVQDVDGWLQNFHMDGNRLRADWCLLETHKETPTMLERAERQPETFGLSFAFKGDPKGTLHLGKRCARAEAIKSCDVVKHAAANPEGLFSAKDGNLMTQFESIRDTITQLSLDTQKNLVAENIELQNTMPNTQQLQNQQQQPTMADVLAQMQALTQQVAQQSEIQQQLVAAHNEGVTGQQNQNKGPTREELEQANAATDEELAAQGLTREQVDQAVAAYNASLGEGENQNEGEGAEGEEGSGDFQGSYGGNEGAAAGAGAGGGMAGGETSAAFSALRRDLIQLKAQMRARDQREAQQTEQIEFSEVQGKIQLVVNQRNQAVELAENLVAENEALRLAIRTGTRPVAAGVDEGLRLFSSGSNGELHPFQQRIKEIQLQAGGPSKMTEAAAMRQANQENPAMHKDWIMWQAKERSVIRA